MKRFGGAAGILAVTSISVSAQSVTSFQTPEYSASGALGQINAAQAYAKGFTGQGVTVGVIDSGIDLTNPDFNTPGKFAGGIIFSQALNASVSDPSQFVAMPAGKNNETEPKVSHGTFVSGIIAAASNGVGIQGVAYNASLYEAAISSLSTQESFDTQVSISISTMVASNVPIINLSLGQNDCGAATAVKTP